MRGRVSVRVAALTLAAWLTATVPAWANMPNPELYPEAAERYERNMAALFYGTIGCFLLMLIVFVLAIVLLVRWLVRRNRAKADEAPAAGASVDAAAPPTAPAMPAPEDGRVEAE